MLSEVASNRGQWQWQPGAGGSCTAATGTSHSFLALALTYPSLTCNTTASSARPFSLLTVLASVVSLTVLHSLTLVTLT